MYYFDLDRCFSNETTHKTIGISWVDCLIDKGIIVRDGWILGALKGKSIERVTNPINPLWLG